MDETKDQLEEQIGQWRSYVARRQAITAQDAEELESHLRDQVSTLVETGLTEDESFLVAVKRMGKLDDVSREFAREHSDRLWKQLVLADGEADESQSAIRKEILVVLGLALLAAISVKIPELFGFDLLGADGAFYARNMSYFVLPFLTGYFAWKRGLNVSTGVWIALVFGATAALVNVFPFAPGAHTQILLILHLPIALWLAVGIAYTGGHWTTGSGRMDFVRFSGELFIYYVLVALGGGVLTAFTLFMFEAIGLNAEQVAQSWLLPCGAVGAVVVCAWLVEAKKSVIENMVPVLARVFTPLFALVLLAFIGTMIWTGSGIRIERDVLIGFDLLLVFVLGLLLYAVSARDPARPPDAFDVLQLVLVVSALIVDVVALWAILARISEFGFSPNKVAALGENVILLVNLAWSAWLYVRFLRGRGPFAALERWQMAYLPVYAAWAAIVVALFPPLFGYV